MFWHGLILKSAYFENDGTTLILEGHGILNGRVLVGWVQTKVKRACGCLPSVLPCQSRHRRQRLKLPLPGKLLLKPCSISNLGRICLRNSPASSVFRRFDQLLVRFRKWSDVHSIPLEIFNKSHAESFVAQSSWKREKAQGCRKVFVRRNSTLILGSTLRGRKG